ncbi:MAG: polysaccharide biosynthesis tyrosine autokinase, partial [Mycobacteriaceae bacterium]
MELREVLAALRAAWWLPAIGLLIGGGAALAVSLVQTPLYTSSTQLFVSTTDSSTTAAAFQGSQLSQQRVTSYAQLITGEELAARVIKRLGLRMTPAQLDSEITATAVTDTVLINVTVSDPSPLQARAIADAVGTEFTAFSNQLEKPDVSGASPVKVTVTNRPDVPGAPSSPQKSRNVALGLLAGLLVGAGLAIARRRLDRTVKDVEDVAGLAGAPVIGTVLRDAALEKQHVIVRSSSNRTAEDYRQLRTNLQFLNVDEPPKVIMISSAVPAEGKTTVVVNLALALADAGRRVTIVAADLRRPTVTRYLGMVGGVGLTNILAGTAEIDEVIQSYGTGELKVIAAGPTPPNPGELLSSSHMFSLIDKLRGQNDFVLVDAPPLLPVAD